MNFQLFTELLYFSLRNPKILYLSLNLRCSVVCIVHCNDEVYNTNSFWDRDTVNTKSQSLSSTGFHSTHLKDDMEQSKEWSAHSAFIYSLLCTLAKGY